MLQLVGGARNRQKAALVLIALRRDSAVSTALDGTIRAVLNDGLAGQLDYYTEYLDVARFPEPDYQPAVRDFFRRKYASQPIDVVVATADAVVDFVNTYRDELFPGAAVVFAASSPRSGPKVTSVVLPLDLKSTIAAAIQLHPDLRQVFSGASAARVEILGEINGLRLTITDNGQGFDIHEARRTGGLGLVSMQERMRPLQGMIAVHSSPARARVWRRPCRSSEHPLPVR